MIYFPSLGKNSLLNLFLKGNPFMKTLLLMRHAKSSWKHPDLPDNEPPLNKRGKKDAPAMGLWMREKKWVPQHILSSSAVRARETAECIALGSGYQEAIDYLDRLYMAEADEYLAALREVPDQFERVLVVGHNPGMETLLQTLSGKIEALPTASLAVLSLPIDHWSELTGDTNGKIVEIGHPGDIRKEVETEKSDNGKEKGKKKKGK
jgi:phosphohistidine phosphatase